MDLEAPFAQLRADRLPAELEDGKVGWNKVEASALRLIATQLRPLCTEASKRNPNQASSQVRPTGHWARKAAEKSMVLLRNEAVDGQAGSAN